MRIDAKDVRNGSHLGLTVWVCHYLRPDLDKKPLRNIPPTKCVIVSNDELPKNKTVYYSKSHFVPIGKDGKRKSTVISPVDNTGYRMRPGNELNVFDNEQECIDQWHEELKIVIDSLDDKIANSQARWQEQKNETFKLWDAGSK